MSDPAAVAKDILIAALDGAFDAVILFEESTGSIHFANKEAVDLFRTSSDSFCDSKIDQIVSFWSFSFEEDKAKDMDDSDSSTSVNTEERAKERRAQQAKDVWEWSQVLECATRAEDPILEWRITGRQQQEGQADSSERRDTTFPGALRLSRVQVGGGALWLAHVRHADHHDIMTNAQSSINSKSGTVATRIKRGSVDRLKVPSITINEHGYIQDISDAGLALNKPTRKGKPTVSGWEWVNVDLIGKHISTVSKAQSEAGAAAPTQPAPKPFRMLDMILESGMEPGHPSQPMSGYPLKVDDGAVSAMTTGGAQREENITEAAFEAALDPIFQIDEHGTIQMVNSAASKAFGWRRAEFLGKDISMICGGGHGPKHAGYLARYLATGDTRVIGKNRELIAKRKDGSEFPIELGVVEVDTFAGEVRLFCGFVRDLTSIKARERLAQEMVDLALDPMFQINGAGKILMVNQAALQTFGWVREELLGHNISIICGGSHGHNHDLYIKKYLRTGETRVIGKYRELPAKRKDGSEFPIQLGTWKE